MYWSCSFTALLRRILPYTWPTERKLKDGTADNIQAFSSSGYCAITLHHLWHTLTNPKRFPLPKCITWSSLITFTRREGVGKRGGGGGGGGGRPDAASRGKISASAWNRTENERKEERKEIKDRRCTHMKQRALNCTSLRYHPTRAWEMAKSGISRQMQYINWGGIEGRDTQTDLCAVPIYVGWTHDSSPLRRTFATSEI